jgi:hypothetical protein
MKKFFWFITGISLGVIAAKQVKENPKAAEFADDISRRAKEFGAAVSEGFREREAELNSAKSSATK